MSRTLRLPHRYPGRCRPRLERLESRLTLSASSDHFGVAGGGSVSAFDTTPPTTLGPDLTPVSVSPAPGALLTQSPTVIAITFDRPIDPISLSFNDVLIQEQQGGSWLSLFNTNNAPAESLDPTGTQLILTIAQPLSAGTYRLVLPELSLLNGLDGSSVADLGQDQVLGTFTVATPGTGFSLAGAAPLASPVSHEVSVSGSLDLQNNPGGVDLYQFTLPAGHRWLLGAEILAQEIGSPLLSTLALFDSQGNLILSASQGKPSAPSDPFLFQGLVAGTYYLGISGASNVPGSPSGYNPATGLNAVNPPSQTGGVYQLDILARTADTPAQLVSFSLQFADPLDPHPTGFVMTFNGALNSQTLQGDPSPGIELVDQNGGIFSVTAVSQNPEAGQYFFLINQDLPAGHYSVIVPNADGATDLAGYTPVARGEPAGVLATFSVRGQTDPNPNDIGPLYDAIHTGVTRNNVLPPLASASFRFVALSGGAYDLNSLYSGGAVAYQLVGPGQAGIGSLGAQGQPNFKEFFLTPGVYTVRFINLGLTSASLTWTLTERTLWDSLLENGLGQGPALNLLLVDRGGAIAGPSPTLNPGPGGAGAGSQSPGGFGRELTAASVASNFNGPNGLFLTLGSTLVGMPATQNEHVGAVGPSTGASSPALASNAAGLLQGIGYGTGIARNGYGEDLQTGGEATGGDDPVNGAMAASDGDEPRPDETVIAAADWVTRTGNAAARWLALASEEEPLAESAAMVTSPAPPIAVVGDLSPVANTEPERVERADLGVPVAIGLAALMSARYHQPLLRWMRHARGHDSRNRPSVRSHGFGPHSRF